MLRLTQRIDQDVPSCGSLTLTHEQRIKGRLRVRLDDGGEAGLFLERGQPLRDGDRVASEDGRVIEIHAASESLSRIDCDDPVLFARACYHLGNRHVALQIDAGVLCYQHDHVLDDMLRSLGLAVGHEQAPFEPEPGAYGSIDQHHSHHHGVQDHDDHSL